MKRLFRIGIDEAWRWPWAGPVVACALAVESLKVKSLKKVGGNYDESVLDFSADKSASEWRILSWKQLLESLWVNDSKKLTEKQREKIFEKMIELSKEEDPKLYFEIWVVDNYLIDEVGIKKANKIAMQRALDWLLKKIIEFDEEDEVDALLLDWNDNYIFENAPKEPIFIVWWDWKVPEISAASIIAKVFRDKLMDLYWEVYWFWFEKNKWYWVKKHKEEMTEKWITNIHRISYKPVKNENEKRKKLLLHVCCWVDVITPILRLKDKYELIAYWYDPNIQPKKEHDKRYRAFKKICDREWFRELKLKSWKLEVLDGKNSDLEKSEIKWFYIKGPYDTENFLNKIRWLENTPERWAKCMVCYDLRLRKTAELARDIWADWWTTTLNSSPKKSFDKMTKIWRNLEKELWVRYLAIDFKKGNADVVTATYCKKNKVYRQTYCWCIYSIRK